MSAVVSITEGVPGSGKSYRRGPHYLITEFLPEDRGLFITNIPIFPEKIAQEVSNRTGKDYQELLDRIVLVPPEVFESWKSGEAGPSEYFNTLDLEEAHIALDEVDAFVGTNAPQEVKVGWRDWASEIRHAGAELEFLTQHVENIYSGMDRVVALHRRFIPHDQLRDPFFGIIYSDWYELRAFVIREYSCTVSENEERRQGKKWKVERVKNFSIEKYYFQFYDSHAASVKSKGKGGKAPLHIYQKYSFPNGLLWFFRRNWGAFASRTVMLGFFSWFFFFGGITIFMSMILNFIQMGVNGNLPEQVQAEVLPAELEVVVGQDNQPISLVPLEDISIVSDVPEPSSLIPEEMRDELTQMPTKPLTEVEILQRRIIALEEERSLIDAKQKAFTDDVFLTLINPDYVMFSNGGRYGKMQKIKGSMWDGLYIAEINFRLREVRLSDGTVLRPGMRNKKRAEKSADSAAAVSANLSGNQQGAFPR